MEEVARSKVTSAYPGKKWADKVRQMSDAQIVAIYFRLRNQGKVS